MVGAPAALGPLGPLCLAALGTLLALAGEGLGPFGPAGDGRHPPNGATRLSPLSAVTAR
jgi:hypothetical protein